MTDIPAILRHFAGEISGVSQNFARDIYYYKVPLRRLYDVMLQAAGKIEDLEKQAIEPGHVKMPATADEAVAMNLVSESWLRANAPERLKPREPVAEIVSAHGDPEAFGERELIALVDIQKFPYRTKLYAISPSGGTE